MKNGVPEYDLEINQGDDFYRTIQYSMGDKPLILPIARLDSAVGTIYQIKSLILPDKLRCWIVIQSVCISLTR